MRINNNFSSCCWSLCKQLFFLFKKHWKCRVFSYLLWILKLTGNKRTKYVKLFQRLLDTMQTNQPTNRPTNQPIRLMSGLYFLPICVQSFNTLCCQLKVVSWSLWSSSIFTTCNKRRLTNLDEQTCTVHPTLNSEHSLNWRRCFLYF